jgi:single-strand selective monofunctional uracil DNA glycosylase
MSIADRLIHATRLLRRDVSRLRFGSPVTHVYDPLDYAMRPHHVYLRRFADAPKRVVLLGMNPGPFGMAQTGVPFGEVAMVRDWLGIAAPVRRPHPEHPKRPVQGFQCTRSEVSGARLWGAIAERYGQPECFFADHFVANYCPLVFMEQSGRNVTPDKLPADEREPLFVACDRFLRRLAALLEPEWIIGVGAFAARRAEATLAGTGIRCGQILHPSPANPRANRDWAGEVEAQLLNLGVCDHRRADRQKDAEGPRSRPRSTS